MSKKKPTTMADILAAKKPMTVTATAYLDPEAGQKVSEARNAHRLAVLAQSRRPDAAGADEKVAKAEKALEAEIEAQSDHAVDFQFRAVGRKVLDVLQKMHPPSAEEQEDHDLSMKAANKPTSKLAHSPTSFPPALFHAAAVEPRMSLEEATELWDSEDFSRAELGAIFDAAWNANQYNPA